MIILEFIAFFILMRFVVIPLYKAVRSSIAASKLDKELLRLGVLYDNCWELDPVASFAIEDEARSKVEIFNSVMKLTPKELLQTVPSVKRFPYWYNWV